MCLKKTSMFQRALYNSHTLVADSIDDVIRCFSKRANLSADMTLPFGPQYGFIEVPFCSFDDTLVVFGSGMSDASRHSNRDLPVLLAGGGIKHAGHLICPQENHKRMPLSNLWLSSLQWFGLEKERFGKSTGTFSPLKIS